MKLEDWKNHEVWNFCSLGKAKYDPSKDSSIMECIELEHISQETGVILGHVDSRKQGSTKNRFTSDHVLFGKLRPYLKKFALPNREGVCSSEIWVLKPEATLCCKEYLFYLVQSERFLSAASISSGSKMPRADWDVVSTQAFSLPPLPEQKKISEILGACDEAIKAQEQLIAQKQERKKSLMQRLLTGKTRFSRFVRSKQRINSRFFDYPADWKFLRIKELADQIIRRNSFGELPVLSCTKHSGLVDSLSYFKKQVFAKDTSGYKVVERGEFAFATNHLEEGSIGYQDLYERAIISPIYCVFKTQEVVNDSWLYPLLKTEIYRHIFDVNTSASINRRGSIRWEEFKSIHIALPNLEEQKAIADCLNAADKEIGLQQTKLEQLKQQKKGLMQRLLTGKVRVKV